MTITNVTFTSSAENAVKVEPQGWNCPWPCDTWHGAEIQAWIDGGNTIAPYIPPPAPPVVAGGYPIYETPVLGMPSRAILDTVRASLNDVNAFFIYDTSGSFSAYLCFYDETNDWYLTTETIRTV